MFDLIELVPVIDDAFGEFKILKKFQNEYMELQKKYIKQGEFEMKNWLRKIGVLEGFSFLVLLGVAMPLKYAYGIAGATKIPGMIHGLLFIAYVALARKVSEQEGWSKKQLWLAYIASALPFGTLLYDYKFLRVTSVESE